MIYNTGFAKDWLENLIEWLRSENDSDMQWTAQTEQLQFCLTEMRQASQPLPPAYRSMPNPTGKQFSRAIPHVENAMRAMQQRNREGALEAATAAVAEL